MNFNQDKVPHLRRKNPSLLERLGSNSEEKNLGGLVASEVQGLALSLGSTGQRHPGLCESAPRQQTEQRCYPSHSHS